MDPATEGGKRPGILHMGSSSPDWLTLRTGVDYKYRCLMCGSVPRAAGKSCIAPLPSSVDGHQYRLLPWVLPVAPVVYSSVHFELQNHPFSMGQLPHREICYYFIFNCYLGCGFWSCPEVRSIECVLEMCPRADHILWTSGLSLICSVSLCWGEGRGGRHSGLSSAVSSSPLACLSVTGDRLEAMWSPLCPGGQGYAIGFRRSVWCSVPGSLGSCVSLLRKS